MSLKQVPLHPFVSKHQRVLIKAQGALEPTANINLDLLESGARFRVVSAGEVPTTDNSDLLLIDIASVGVRVISISVGQSGSALLLL